MENVTSSMTQGNKPMSDKRKMTRRTLLKGAAAAFAAPYIITSTALGANGRPSASNRITMGMIGVGGQGGGHVRGFAGDNGVQVVAVCDVDRNHRNAHREWVNGYYAARQRSGAYEGCKAYADFRKLLARDDIDAVMIATPDHWHCAVTVAAAQAGKDIYCEKPLSQNLLEGRAAADAVKRYHRVFQTGSQERSNRNCRYGCELVRNGRIGKLHTIRVNLPLDRGRHGVYRTMDVPDGLDWDFWLGPAPWAPYTKDRAHFFFRYLLDHSGGEMTDRGAHIIDLAQWGNGTDGSGPVEVEGTGDIADGHFWDTAWNFKVTFTYANGVKLHCKNSGPRGVKFEGADGWLFIGIHGGHLSASDPDILRSKIGPGDTHLHKSPGHRQDFLRAVRTRGDTVAPAEVGHRTASLCHLANIAMLVGRRLKFDPDGERFANDPGANRLLTRTMREPWHL